MTQTEYLDFHERLCGLARALSAAKNTDYADPDARQHDPLAVFANFCQCANLNICTVEQGFLVRLSDKFSRLANLLRVGHEQAVKDESVDDTIKDIINYVVLLAAYRKAVSRQAEG